MGDTAAGLLFVSSLALALVLAHRPLGDHLARVFADSRHHRVERVLYRVGGIDPDAEQRWPVYLRGVLAFSAVSVLVVFGLQRLQAHLPWSLGNPAVPPALAWNTAVSYVTNTNWQNYGGESTMGHLVQTAGLAVQNFVSAAVGIAVAIALVRGFARTTTDRLGNFWVDLVRACLRVLLPLSVVGAVVLIAGGRGAEPPRLHRRDDAGRRLAVDPRRPGRLPGGHQGAGHQRRRLLQRQLRAPVREPHRRGRTGSRSFCCW